MNHESTRISLLVRIRDPLDHDAWERFVRIYLPAIFRMARRYGLNDADAADAAQDVLTAVHQRIGGFHYDPTKGSFRGWLKTVARSRICDLLDRQKRQAAAIGGTDAALQLAEFTEEPSVDPFERDYQQGLIDAALVQVRGEFEAQTFQAFYRCGVAAEKPADVALELGMSVGAVYIAKSRVMTRLRSLIQDWEQDEMQNG